MRWVPFDRDGDGRSTAKKIDNKKVEGYGWGKKGRLSWFFDDLARETSWFEYGDEEARLPVSMKHGGQRYMLGWDHVGSLRAMIDAQGKVVKEIEYDAFGNILRETAPELRVPFGFAGGLHDRDTGLIRYRFRDYLPDTGRFTAKDPIGYKGGDSDLYGYCLDDPVNGIDPSGLGAVQLLTAETPSQIGNHDTGLTMFYDTHSALQTCMGNGTDCELWDPAGSYYYQNQCGTGQICRDENAEYNRFLEFHETRGSEARAVSFGVPDEAIVAIREKIEDIGPVQPLDCAVAVSNSLIAGNVLKPDEYSSFPLTLEETISHRMHADSGSGGGRGGKGGGGL